MPPALSVIIPAYNAAETIAVALDSLRAQTRGDWEAIVVDDGSTDDTAGHVELLAKAEPRLRLVRAAHGGVSAARNQGLEAALADWLLYLDADDWIAPDFVEVMCAAAAESREVSAVYCDWLRVTPTGSYPVEQYESPGADLFALLADRCIFAIHSCIIRKELVQSIGGFDTSLRTSEDWDLWMKAARTGAHFKYVNKVLSFYCARPGSASLDGLQLLRDGLEVMRRAHRPDDRVVPDDPKYGNGAPLDELPTKQLHLFCYVAGVMIGSQAGVAALLSEMPPTALEPDANQIAYITLDAIVVGSCRSREELPALWPSIRPDIELFLLEMETKVSSPLFRRRTILIMERLVGESRHSGEKCELSLTAFSNLEVSAPIADLLTNKEVERAFLKVTIKGAEIGTLYLPVTSGRVKSGIIQDAIAAEYAWTILEHYFAPLYRTSLRFPESEKMAHRGDLCLGAAKSENIGDLHAQFGWVFFLQELWDCPTALEAEFYVCEASGSANSRRPARRIVIEVAEELPNLKTRAGKLEIEVKVGGASIGLLQLDAERISSQQYLRAAISTHFGTELLTSAVREGLVGRPGVESLRVSLRQAVSQSLSNQDSIVLGRRSPYEVGGTISRRCDLPPDGFSYFSRLAQQYPEPMLASSTDSSSIAYTPEVIANEVSSNASTHRQKQTWLSRVSRRFKAEETFCDRVPILMYHRVAPEGQAPLARYRVAPDRFVEHLDYLQGEHYSTMTLEAWGRAVESKKPVSGKPIIITFDDGYLDFAQHAWPALKKHGCEATMFLVSDLIGRTNEWNLKYGEVVPLMDWPEILRLQGEGVEFGSHTATHPYMTGLTPSDFMREAAGSRATLQEKLGLVTSLAYPHGDEDAVVRRLAGGCGYRCAVSCEPGISSFNDTPMALKRIEVCGTDTAGDLARKLGAS